MGTTWRRSVPERVVGGAAIGSYIVCEVLSVSGPAGGVLSFWEQGWRTPTYQFPVGAPLSAAAIASM